MARGASLAIHFCRRIPPALAVCFLAARFLAACVSPQAAAVAADVSPPDATDAAATTTVDAASAPDVAAVGAKPTTALVSNQRIAYSDGLHNENTDLISWKGATWLVFRGGEFSQGGSPKARLKVFRSLDLGDELTMTAEIFMPERDIRDPKFLIQDGKLAIYAISRIPGGHVRDEGGLAWTVRSETSDGSHWSPPTAVYDEKWGFWRYAEHGGLYWATGYNDGDVQVGLFSSADGSKWRKVSLIYDSQPDVPSEAELQFFGETAVSLVRLDNGASLLDEGHTAICVAPPPYVQWNCARKLDKRLDGPKWFAHKGRQFIMARKHIADGKKRTALYELRGDLADVAAAVHLDELFEFQSAGDTAYVGVMPMGGAQFLVSWYSGVVATDEPWITGMFAPTDIWLAWVDLAFLP